MSPLAHLGAVSRDAFAAMALAMSLPALAQSGATSSMATKAADSGASYCTFGKVQTYQLDGRVGLKMFLDGAEAFRRKDYLHAVYMYKVAASYGDEAAEYDLGLMYFRGNGVAVNRPLGAAWMVLAAERGNPLYVKARNWMVSALADAQFATTDKLRSQLKKTYGEAGLARASIALFAARMNDVAGSHLGIRQVGEVRSGTLGPNGSLQIIPGITDGDALGILSYQQQSQTGKSFVRSLLECPSGSVHVGPLQQANVRKGQTRSNPSGDSGTQPRNLDGDPTIGGDGP